MTPSSNQQKSFLKKWMPAIGLALFVHLIVIIIFLNNSADSSKTVQDSEHTAVLEAASKNAINNKTQNLPPLKTLNSNQTGNIEAVDAVSASNTVDSSNTTDSNTVANTRTNTDNDVSQQSSISNNQTPHNLSVDQSDTINTSSLNNAKSSAVGSSEINDKEVSNASNSKQGEINKANVADKVDDKMLNATLATVDKSSQNTASDESKTVITQDALLLKRERIATDDISNGVMAEYDRIAQQAEKETERLSQTINQIKEENRRQIVNAQQQQMSTYNKNNQALSEKIDKVSNELGLGELAEEEFSEVE